MNLLLSR